MQKLSNLETLSLTRFPTLAVLAEILILTEKMPRSIFKLKNRGISMVGISLTGRASDLIFPIIACLNKPIIIYPNALFFEDQRQFRPKKQMLRVNIYLEITFHPPGIYTRSHPLPKSPVYLLKSPKKCTDSLPTTQTELLPFFRTSSTWLVRPGRPVRTIN